jgi:Domain of unknown function (DUF3850)
MAVHEIKIAQRYFDAVHENRKTFEIRINDRGYQVGDTLSLREITATKNDLGQTVAINYTGRKIEKVVTYIISLKAFFSDHPGIIAGVTVGREDDYVVMGIKTPEREPRYGPGLNRYPPEIMNNLPAYLRKLEDFKGYVHQRLDQEFIPANPPGEHADEGCRIGQRLDWLFNYVKQLENKVGSDRQVADDDTAEQSVSVDGLGFGTRINQTRKYK